jgi:phage virion morphogenesis protein
MEVQIDLTQVNTAFTNLGSALDDATPLFNLIGQELELSIDDSFRTETDPDGSPWASLDPSYVAQKVKRGFIPKINQRRGDLRASISYKAYSDRLEIGANVPYSKNVQDKRPFLYSESGGLGRRRELRIEETANQYFQRLVQGL